MCPCANTVGALKQKYEEGMVAAAPKKQMGPPPAKRAGSAGPGKIPTAKPTGQPQYQQAHHQQAHDHGHEAHHSPATSPQNAASPATSPQNAQSPLNPAPADHHQPVHYEQAPAETGAVEHAQAQASSPRPVPAAAPAPAQPVQEPAPQQQVTQPQPQAQPQPQQPQPHHAPTNVDFNVFDAVPESAQPRTATPTNSASPGPKAQDKEAMKKTLEGMILPARKKPAPMPAAGGAATASSDLGSSEDNKSASTTTASSAPAAATASPAPKSTGSVASQDVEGTSDDDISSDEEEYLRGVEERRQKAIAEKENRLKAAKEAKEARQGMYAFLNDEPPPGFVQQKPTPTGKDKKDKTKKAQKDKASAKGSSKGTVTSDAVSDLKKSSGTLASSTGSLSKQRTDSKSNLTGNTAASSSTSTAMGRSTSDLDLSSSPVASTKDSKDPVPTSTTPSSDPASAWTTRYRPSQTMDHSIWQRAEEAIRNDPAPTRKRWEECKARYEAKSEAAKTESVKKTSSVPNVKTPVSIKNLKSAHVKRDSVSSGQPDSPRRRSNADDSGEKPEHDALRRSESISKKPPPKLETIDDPRVYLFEAMETEGNVRYMEKNGEEALAGGTVEKLIQRLTSQSDPSPEYFHVFMLTYHNFLTPSELIELLRLRWNSQPSDPSRIETFVNVHLFPIRLRIVNVLKMWIETFGNDFKDEAAQAALNSFIEYIRLEYPQMADMVAVKLKRLLSGQYFGDETEIDEDPPVSYPITEGRETNPTMLDIHPEEFARQMSLVEHALFKAIPYKELLTNAKAGKNNPNVANMISYTNHLVNWIGTQILRQEDIKARAVTLARFITVARCCIILHQNYNGAMEILSALRSSAIWRLKNTWNLLPDSTWDDYEWLEDLYESDNNFARYRAALSNAVPPCVPYLGRYLSDVLFLNEIHPDYLSQGPPPVINYAKMVLVADILHHLQRYQKNPFCLTGVPIIQRFFLLKRGVMNEKDLYKLALEREPRETQ